MLTSSEINSLVQRIVVRMQPQKVMIFGSYAKGTATIQSDLDILVIKETELPMANRANEVKPILFQALIPVDVHIYTPEEVEVFGKEPYSFINSILVSGRIVFEKSQLPLSPNPEVEAQNTREIGHLF
jgi:uncharacterized protein